MEEKLLHIKNNALSLVLEAKTSEELDEVKLQLLGKNGSLTQAFKLIGKVSPEEKAAFGRLINETKEIVQDALSQAKENLKQHISHSRAPLDVTDPGILPPLGHLHPVTQAIEEITTIFERIGFTRVRYPEIDYDWYAFEALNFPKNHPARDDWETFFIDAAPDPKKGLQVLTPHTSNGQIRELLQHQLPIKMLNIAKTYRRQSDVSHTPMFHQMEGLVVGEHISIVHLKGTLDYFFQSYFGKNRISRIRPYHFQFTEPSFEIDVSCGVCKGTGFVISNGVRDPKEISREAQNDNREKCKLCKEGWLELGGAGMVHPNVLRATEVNPDLYSGFAFGWGIERIAMMREGMEIDDGRTLYSNKLDFLEQF